MADFKNLWSKSGARYVEYSSKFSQYIETSQIIVELAGIAPGQTVVDLACGSGLTAVEIAKKLAGSGRIYCVDFAESMLNEARKIVPPKLAEFIVASAEELAGNIPELVDRVIANAAFWQFRDQANVLKSIRNILKPDGKFAFSLPQQFYEMAGESHRGLIVRAIFKEMEMRGYDPKDSFVPKLTEKTLTKLLLDNGFAVQTIERRELAETTLDDGLAFFLIPAVAPFFEKVPLKVQKEILTSVRQKLRDSYAPSPNRWAFVVATLR